MAQLNMSQAVGVVQTSLIIVLIVHASVQNDHQPTLTTSAKTTLQFVAVITRHGSRSPLSTFPNDLYPYTDRRFWPNGPSELSNLGKVQLYHTGKYLRARYECFMDPIYRPNATEVTYNPYNRDYMSSACLTAGMYPPVDEQIWDPTLLWIPVVQSVREFDVCDLSDNGMCPKFKKLFDEETEKFNEDSNAHQELLEYVSKQAGTNFTKLSDIYDVYDTLLMQAQNGYKLPQWSKKVFPFRLRPFAISYLSKTYAGSDELVKLGAGPELKYISDAMNMKANGTYEAERKFYIESAHDCTLISLLRAFGNQDPNLEIQTGAYLLFELHLLPPDYLVQVFYFRTSYDEDPATVDIKGCPNPCSLSDFNKFVDSINPSNYEESCRV